MVHSKTSHNRIRENTGMTTRRHQNKYALSTLFKSGWKPEPKTVNSPNVLAGDSRGRLPLPVVVGTHVVVRSVVVVAQVSSVTSIRAVVVSVHRSVVVTVAVVVGTSSDRWRIVSIRSATRSLHLWSSSSSVLSPPRHPISINASLIASTTVSDGHSFADVPVRARLVNIGQSSSIFYYYST